MKGAEGLDFEASPFVTLFHQRGEVPVVKVSGELDLLTSPRFRDALEEVVSNALEQSRPGVIVVDLSGVEFMDSSGVNALVGATRKFSERGGKVRLVIKTSPALRTLEITGLERIFEVYPDVGSASCRGVA